jgi:hypothetical protein
MATKLEILTQAKEVREQEVLEYQINVDNYVLGIAQLEASGEQPEFKVQLEQLLSDTRREMGKAQLMLDVINIQLNQMQPA